MALGDVQMKRLSVDELRPAEYNPRTISDSAKKGLSASINEFGLVQPIIWNDVTGHVVGGHQRLNELIEKKVKHTDVVVVSLPEDKEKVLNVTLNNNAISGEFTDELQDLLKEMDDNTKEILMLNKLEENKSTPGLSFNSIFQIVIDCDDENHQRQLYEQLHHKGIKCKLQSI